MVFPNVPNEIVWELKTKAPSELAVIVWLLMTRVDALVIVGVADTGTGPPALVGGPRIPPWGVVVLVTTDWAVCVGPGGIGVLAGSGVVVVEGGGV